MDDTLIIAEEDVKRYYQLNKQKKQIENELNHLKNKFHKLLDDAIGKEQKTEIQRGNYKLQRQVRTSTSFLEDKTVQKLEQLNLEDFIIISKRPDTDKLKAAFELGLAEEDAFSDCIHTRISQAIVVREV